jgi:hypothetical protein
MANDICDKPFFFFECDDARTFSVSDAVHTPQVVLKNATITLSASDTIAPLLCANNVFKFNDVAKNTFARVAFVSTNGSDSTGTIGDADFPYLTMQAAYDAGARTFHLSGGTFAGIAATAVGTEYLFILGVSGDLVYATYPTLITEIYSTTRQELRVVDLGVNTFFLYNLGRPGDNNQNGPAVGAKGCSLNTIIVSGGMGLLSATPAPSGGMVTLENCKVFEGVYTTGGRATALSADGGSAGTIYLTNCTLYTPSAASYNFNGGNALSGNGGAAASAYFINTEVFAGTLFQGGSGISIGGRGGIFDVRNSRVTASVDTRGGKGTVSGNNCMATLRYAYMTSIDGRFGAISSCRIDSSFSEIVTALGTPLITAKLSRINNTTY